MILRPNLGEYPLQPPLWQRSQRLAQWLKATPALLALLACLGVAVVYFRRDPVQLEAMYTRIADAALAAEDYAQARVASERLLMFDSRQREAHVLRLGKSLAGMGRVEMAVTVVSQMVPATSAQNAPAHLFIADAVLNHPVANPDHLRIAEQHLKQVLAVDPNSLEAQALLGQYYFQAGDRTQAKRQLELVYPKRNEVALPLSAVALAEGNTAEAVKWAEAAIECFQRQAQQQPEQWLARWKWAEAETVLGHPNRALAVLEAGIKQADQPAYHQLAARILAGQAYELAQKAPSDLADRLDLLRRGVKHDPHNDLLLMQLVRLAAVEDNEKGSATVCLKELERVGENRAGINFCRGMLAWEKRDLSTAIKYLDDAYTRDPDNGLLANNLAYLLATGTPPDCKRGLELIEKVLLSFPSTPMFRETHGRILALMGRWPEAAGDLEFAARYLGNSATIHDTLAEVYEQIRLPQLSAKHRHLAEEIRSKAAN